MLVLQKSRLPQRFDSRLFSTIYETEIQEPIFLFIILGSWALSVDNLALGILLAARINATYQRELSYCHSDRNRVSAEYRCKFEVSNEPRLISAV